MSEDVKKVEPSNTDNTITLENSVKVPQNVNDRPS